MMTRALTRRTVAALATALLLATSSASAQWVWKDDGGRVVASDQPPPTSVPQSRIIKEPSARVARTAPAPAASAGPTEPTKSLADRELESRQHDKEQAEASKKAEDEAAKARAMQDNCSAVRGNLAALQAGGRAARFNEKGERVYIDDAQRGAEIAKSQQQLGQYCK